MKNKKFLNYILSVIILVCVFIVSMILTYALVSMLFGASGIYNSTDNNTLNFYFNLMQFFQDATLSVGVIAGVYISSKLLKFELKNFDKIIISSIVFYLFMAFLMRYTTTFALPSFGGILAIILFFAYPLFAIYLSLNEFKKTEFKKN